MAKYVSRNELGSFVFHDSIFERVEFENAEMIWYIPSLDVEKTNSQNKNRTAMCTKEAKVIFKNYRFVSFYHKNTGCLPPLTKREVLGLFEDYPIHFSFVFPGETAITNRYCGDVELILPGSLKQFSVEFSGIIIEWDEYYGKSHWVK